MVISFRSIDYGANEAGPQRSCYLSTSTKDTEGIGYNEFDNWDYYELVDEYDAGEMKCKQ